MGSILILCLLGGWLICIFPKTSLVLGLLVSLGIVAREPFFNKSPFFKCKLYKSVYIPSESKDSHQVI